MSGSSTTDDMLAALGDTLSASASVSSKPRITHATSEPHPRFGLYKARGYQEECQEVRREKLLKHQKKRREEYRNWAR